MTLNVRDPDRDIVTLLAPDAGPQIELLHYRHPAPSAPRAIARGDIAATQTTLALSAGEMQDDVIELVDPDGHRMRFSAS